VTFADFNREVQRICAYLNRFPVAERMAVLKRELEKLPAEAREPALTLTATIVDIAERDVAAPKRRRLVILVHGIRTRAEWQGRIRGLLEADGETDVETLGYGYFDALRFLCPLITRRAPIVEVERNIRDAFKLHADHGEVVFVGHSFGTYILGKILAERPDIVPDRVLLCGSIVSRKFRWDKLPNRPKGVLNEAGSRDIWPILANSTTWGYGSTGTFGFKAAGVRDRYHNCAHSDYFKPGFAEEYWLPWIKAGKLVPSPFEIGAQAPTPFFKNLLELLPIKYILILILVIAAWLVLHKIRSAHTKVDQRATSASPASGPRECRLPQHGVEYWKHTEKWTADSGWRGGGSSEEQFCGAAKLTREKKYPDRTIALISENGSHRVVYNLFKHDEYRYNCTFEDQWDPVYKLAPDDACPPN
jgi:pimeloyl-ACP methyl ester carboxylesterase